jgi:hypothetical protein
LASAPPFVPDCRQLNFLGVVFAAGLDVVLVSIVLLRFSVCVFAGVDRLSCWCVLVRALAGLWRRIWHAHGVLFAGSGS